MASQSSLGRMLVIKGVLISISTCSSSASCGWSGKAVAFVLQALRAQVRKFRVRSFIFIVVNLGFCLGYTSVVVARAGWLT